MKEVKMKFGELPKSKWYSVLSDYYEHMLTVMNSHRRRDREENKQEFIGVIIWSLVHVCSFDSMTTENKTIRCVPSIICLIHFS
jgi:hypothetical protein